ncbi:MAG: nickel pincer cofactor biosynthesis protein LarB [Acidobacteriota bacterium]|jgi:NCAIR mutase (PurE)-related protein
MDRDRLAALLAGVAGGDVSVDEALDELRGLPFRDIGYAKLDTHRPLRTGHPEVVFGAGKEPEQLAGIVGALAADGHPVLVTRLATGARELLRVRFPEARFDAEAKAMVLGEPPCPRGNVAVLCAGTSDIPVAAEAALTAETLGSRVQRHWDVGVAGLQRVLSVHDQIGPARVVVVVAGMEGALPSVVGGLVHAPVIAVPTSIGYGASYGGLAALLGMLNSCAPGVSVVNIDNGFGAGYLAHLINDGAPGDGRVPDGTSVGGAKPDGAEGT